MKGIYDPKLSKTPVGRHHEDIKRTKEFDACWKKKI